MALTLDAIRTFVRLHLDLDTEDLPDSLVDVFIREGSKRIEKASSRWPFYEKVWTVSTMAGQRSYPFTDIGTDVDQIAAILRDDETLHWVGNDLYSILNPIDATSQSKPVQYAWWNDTLYLTPTPDSAYTLTVFGYRDPIDWIANGAGAQPDLPDELHNTVAIWALSKAYIQQEDPEMGSVYERQFADELTEFKRRITETPHPQPLVLNGQAMSVMRPFGRMRFDWE